MNKKLEDYLDAQINLRTKNRKQHRKHPLMDVQKNPNVGTCLTCKHLVTSMGYFHWSSHEKDCLHLKGGLIELPAHWFKTKREQYVEYMK